MKEEVSKNNIRLVTRMLALYFLCIAFDSFSLGAIGSIAKVVAFLPMICAVLDFRNLFVRVDRYLVLMMLFWGCTVTSLFYTIDFETTLQYAETLTLNIAMIILLGGMETYSEAEVRYLIKALIAGGWLTVILTLIYADYTALGRLTIRVGDVVQDQNGLNGYFMITFAWHLYNFLDKKKRFHVVPAAFLFMVSVLTGSRGAVIAYISMILFMSVYVWMNEGTFQKKIRVLFGVIVIGFLIYGLVKIIVPEQVSERFTLAYLQRKGTTGRMKIWGTLWIHFKRDSVWCELFGHGYGTTKLVNTFKNYVAHNLYLDNLISIGVVGMSVHLMMQMTFLGELIRQKYLVLITTFIGYMALCCSLSLVSYKPIWNIMMITLIIQYRKLEND